MSRMLKAWLSLFRLPNLLTVPGDPIAGAFLASLSAAAVWPNVLPVAIASIAFYKGGLALNDFFDFRRDWHVHPERPLPSGAIKPVAALLAGVLANVIGLILCFFAGETAFWIGVTLVVAALLYNRVFKRVPLLGPFMMGACRGLNVLLGAAVIEISGRFSVLALLGALIVAAYVTAFTVLARREHRPHYVGWEVWVPFGLLTLGLLLLIPIAEILNPGALLAYGVAMSIAFAAGWKLKDYMLTPNLPLALERKAEIPEVMPLQVGRLISVLPWLQIAFILQADNSQLAWLLAGLLVLAYLINRITSRIFYAS